MFAFILDERIVNTLISYNANNTHRVMHRIQKAVFMLEKLQFKHKFKVNIKVTMSF